MSLAGEAGPYARDVRETRGLASPRTADDYRPVKVTAHARRRYLERVDATESYPTSAIRVVWRAVHGLETEAPAPEETAGVGDETTDGAVAVTVDRGRDSDVREVSP